MRAPGADACRRAHFWRTVLLCWLVVGGVGLPLMFLFCLLWLLR